MLLNPLITQSTWIAYLSGFTCDWSSPTEPATEMGAWWARMGTKICQNHCAITSLSLLQCWYEVPWVYWLDYRQVIFVSLFKRRGKLIKLLEVKCETERTTVPVRYWCMHSTNARWCVPLCALFRQASARCETALATKFLSVRWKKNYKFSNAQTWCMERRHMTLHSYS